MPSETRRKRRRTQENCCRKSLQNRMWPQLHNIPQKRLPNKRLGQDQESSRNMYHIRCYCKFVGNNCRGNWSRKRNNRRNRRIEEQRYRKPRRYQSEKGFLAQNRIQTRLTLVAE